MKRLWIFQFSYSIVVFNRNVCLLLALKNRKKQRSYQSNYRLIILGLAQLSTTTPFLFTSETCTGKITSVQNPSLEVQVLETVQRQIHYEPVGEPYHSPSLGSPDAPVVLPWVKSTNSQMFVLFIERSLPHQLLLWLYLLSVLLPLPTASTQHCSGDY